MQRMADKSTSDTSAAPAKEAGELTETTRSAVVDQEQAVPQVPAQVPEVPQSQTSPGMSAAVVAAVEAAVDKGKYLIGKWHDFDNYGCPHCEHKTLDGSAAIAIHIINTHPGVNHV